MDYWLARVIFRLLPILCLLAAAFLLGDNDWIKAHIDQACR